MPINQYQGGGGSPLMNLIGMFQQGKSLMGGGGKSPSGGGTEGQPTPILGSGKTTAMDRRLGDNQNIDPSQAIDQGLDALKDPNFPGSYEEKMAYVEPLLRAKHFGYGGGINDGKMQGGQGLGAIASTVAALV